MSNYLHNEIQAALYRRHKVSYTVLSSLRTTFTSVWFGLWLWQASGGHFVTSVHCDSDIILSVYGKILLI